MKPTPVTGRVEALYREHGAGVLAYLARRVPDPDTAADLLGEVVVTLWRRSADLPPAGEDKLWFFGVARNVLANHRRSALRHRAMTERLGEELRRTRPRASESGTALEVRQAIDQLGPLDRELVRLSVWEGFTSVEIGTLLKMSPDTVRSRLKRAREQLSRDLRAELSETQPATGR